MGDFFTNLNKGIENIVPLAMKKFELDSEKAKWEQHQALAEKTFDIADQKWKQELDILNKRREFGNVLAQRKAQLDELTGQVEPLREKLTAATGDTVTDVSGDPGEFIAAKEKLTPLIPKLAALQKQMEPENLLTEMAAADPHEGFKGIMELAKEKASAARALSTSDIKRYIAETALRGRQGSDDVRLLVAQLAADAKKNATENKLLPAHVEKNLRDTIYKLDIFSDPKEGPELQKKLDRARIQYGPQVNPYDILDTDKKQRVDAINAYATEAVQKGQAKTYNEAYRIGKDRYLKEQGGATAPGGKKAPTKPISSFDSKNGMSETMTQR